MEELAHVQQEEYFTEYWPLLLRFRGEHPIAAKSYIDSLRLSEQERFAEAERSIINAQKTLKSHLSRSFWRINYDVRWRSRWLNPLVFRNVLL